MDKKISQQMILTITAFILLAAAVLAWFFTPPDPKSMVEVSSGGGSIADVKIYHVTYDDKGNETETETDKIEIVNFIPGTSERYRIKVSNPLAERPFVLSFKLSGFNAGQNAEGLPAGDLTLCRYIEISENMVIHDPPDSYDGELLYKGTLNSLNGDSDITELSSVMIADNINVAAGGMISLTLDFRLSENANNFYQNKAVYISNIEYFE